MKNKDKLCKSLDNIFRERAKFQLKTREEIKDLSEQSGMPIDMCSDLINGRIDIETASAHQLYLLMAYYLKLKELTVKQEDYFSKAEINAYSKSKYKIKKLEFPIRIPAIQVNTDQWIGTTSVKQLMEFRDAGLIYYNENTQRTLERIIDGEHTFFKITLNKKAIAAIRGLLNKNLFIPNTLTFNISLEDIDKIKYDSTSRELIIDSIDHFDIIDGYHRYIALSNEYNVNNEFDYPMEIRVVCFEEPKAQQFIHQEDQKTEMNKIDSDAYNQNDLGNVICQRLNENSVLKGKIGLNNAIINKGVMARFIDYYTGKEDDAKKALEYTKKLRNGYELLLEEDLDLLDKEWRWEFTAASVMAIMNDVPDLKSVNTLSDKIVNSQKGLQHLSKRVANTLVKEVKYNE